MLLSTLTSPNWEKRTFIVLEDPVSLCEWNLIPVELSAEVIWPLKLLVPSSRALRTPGPRHQPHHLRWPLQPERDRGAAGNRDQTHPRHHRQEPVCGRISQRERWRSQAMSEWVEPTTYPGTGELMLTILFFSSLQISPSSIPHSSSFHPLSWSFFFFVYSFCLPHLDATIRNVCFDGLIFMQWGLCAASPRSEDTSTGRKEWDRGQRIPVHNLKNAQPVPTDQRMTPSILHLVFSEFNAVYIKCLNKQLFPL